MTTSPTTIKSDNNQDHISRGQLAYVCARNQAQAHSLLVRAVRESGLSQKQLSKLTGIDEATVSRVLRRPRNVELNTLSKLVFGACGAMISFSLFLPVRAREIGTHLAVKTEETTSTAEKFFFFEAVDSLKSSTSRTLTATNEARMFSNIISLETTEYRVREKLNA